MDPLQRSTRQTDQDSPTANHESLSRGSVVQHGSNFSGLVNTGGGSLTVQGNVSTGGGNYIISY